MGTDSRPVCHRCAQIKQACDGNLPCARCVRLSLPCRPRNSAGANEEEQNGDVPKARIRRVQTGCLMCKRRKKKCDEMKPRCGDCRRLCLDCAWPPERHMKSKGEPKTDHESLLNGFTTNMGIVSPIPTPTILNSVSEITFAIRSSPSPVTTPIGSRQLGHDSPGNHSLASNSSQPSYSAYAETNGSAADHARMMAAVTSTMPMSSLATMEPITTTTSSILSDLSPDGSPQSLSWDLPNTPPNNWLDSITPVSNGSPAPSANSGSHDSPNQSLSVYVPQLMPQLSSTQDKALFNHYCTIVSSILSRRAAIDNPYNGFLLPMAQSNDLVLHCILALSANHWRKMQPEMADRGMMHKSKATQSLAGLLPHVDRTSADVALVSSLLLCMTELFDGTSEGWKLHLKGAKRLLYMLRKQQGDRITPYYKFLLRLARFLDSAATTSTCRPPLMGDEAAEAQALDSWSSSPDEDDSAIYGIPKGLFHLVDHVNTLAELRSTRVDPASEAEFRRRADAIKNRIDTWSYEYGGMPRANKDVLHATLAFENAIRLRLHQIVDGYELTDPKVGKFVEGIVESVQKIRYGSPLEPCILFPLVMAGGSCWKLEHRVIIQDRLLVMERTCGFGYIYNARDLVERVWSRRDQSEGTGTIVNWASIRYYEMHGLVVF